METKTVLFYAKLPSNTRKRCRIRIGLVRILVLYCTSLSKIILGHDFFLGFVKIHLLHHAEQELIRYNPP